MKKKQTKKRVPAARKAEQGVKPSSGVSSAPPDLSKEPERELVQLDPLAIAATSWFNIPTANRIQQKQERVVYVDRQLMFEPPAQWPEERRRLFQRIDAGLRTNLQFAQLTLAKPHESIVHVTQVAPAVLDFAAKHLQSRAA